MYFKYFETARLNHFLRIGEALKATTNGDAAFDFDGFLQAKAVGPILQSTGCVFKAPGGNCLI
jgi:hypothetical protein